MSQLRRQNMDSLQVQKQQNNNRTNNPNSATKKLDETEVSKLSVPIDRKESSSHNLLDNTSVYSEQERPEPLQANEQKRKADNTYEPTSPSFLLRNHIPLKAPPVEDDRENLFNNARSRVINNEQFELDYTEDDLASIYEKGKSLLLDDKVIEDMIFAGSRTKKHRNAEELKEEMNNWVNVVQKRGYPYKFTGEEQFEEFKKDLLEKVRKLGLPCKDVRVQGSSLRKPEANDIDIAVFVTKEKFAELLKAKFDKKIKENKVELDLTSKTYDQLKDLAEKIKKHGKDVYNNNISKNFVYHMEKGIITSKSSIVTDLNKATKELAKKYENLNIESISVLLLGGKFELKPDMTIT